MSEKQGIYVSGEVLVKKLRKNTKKPVESVENIAQDLIIRVISRLRDAGLSYGQISAKFGINKGTLIKIHHRTWFPKQKHIQDRYLGAIYGNR